MPSRSQRHKLLYQGVDSDGSTSGWGLDNSPNQFTFTDLFNLPLNNVTTSVEVTLTGMDIPSTATVSAGGQFNVDGGSYNANPKSVKTGSRIKLRRTTSATNNTTVSTTFTVGTTSDVWAIKTIV